MNTIAIKISWPMKPWELEALRAGRRTQARRPVKFPVQSAKYKGHNRTYTEADVAEMNRLLRARQAAAFDQCFRYGQVGDVVWVQETGDMRREQARLFLRITGIRVERLHEITDGDVHKEGVVWQEVLYTPQRNESLGTTPAQRAFRAHWDEDIRKYYWKDNPFVYVITYEKLPVDNLVAAVSYANDPSKEGA